MKQKVASFALFVVIFSAATWCIGGLTAVVNSTLSSEGPPLLQWKAVRQTLELLLPQLDLVLQLALLDNERRLHLDEVLIVGQVLLTQTVGQDIVDDVLPPV